MFAYVCVSGRLVVLWTELTNYLCCTPHLRLVESGEFLLEAYTVVWLRVGVDRDLSLVASLD